MDAAREDYKSNPSGRFYPGNETDDALAKKQFEDKMLQFNSYVLRLGIDAAREKFPLVSKLIKTQDDYWRILAKYPNIRKQSFPVDVSTGKEWNDAMQGHPSDYIYNELAKISPKDLPENYSPDITFGDYDSGVKIPVDKAKERLAAYYNSQNQSQPNSNSDQNQQS